MTEYRNTELKIQSFLILVFALSVLLVFNVSSESVWGLVGLFYISKSWLLVLTVAGATIVLLGGGLVSKISNLFRSWDKFNPRVAIIITLLIAAVIFWMLRSSNLILGDGLWLIDHVYDGEYIFSAGSVTILLHIITAKILSGFFDSPSLLAFRLISIVSGIVYLQGSILLSKELFQDRDGRVFGVVSFLALGVIQLFFGYVETYALPISLTPLLFYFVLKYLRGRGSLFLILLVFAIMCLFHMAAISIAPAVLFLMYVNTPKNIVYGIRHYLLVGSLIAAGVLGAVLLENFDGRMFVGLSGSGEYPYSYFSLQHLTDLLNRLALVSSFSLFLFLVWLFFGKKESHTGLDVRYFRMFCVIGAVSTMLFSSLIDPKLGAFRDWDLQSFFAIPLHAAVLSLICTNGSLMKHSNNLAAAGVSFCLFFSVPWVVFNHAPVANTIALSSKIIESDIHYTTAYDSGARMKSWAVILNDAKVGAYPEAEKVLEKYLAGNPDDLSALHMLGYSNMKQGSYKIAYQISQILFEREPKNPRYLLQSAYLAAMSSNGIAAIEMLEELPASNMDLPIVVGVRALANYELGNKMIAKDLFYDSMNRGNKDVEIIRKYSLVLKEDGLIDSSLAVSHIADSLEDLNKEFK